jgi:plastocyanin
MIEELWSGIISFSQQYVVPDWGSLIALLPVFLLIPVVLYVTWTMYRYATAAPTRRGKRRLPPAAPAGIHMPGPSFAPVLGALGAFFLVFGFVVGGLWMAIGGIILAVTLLYWGREALRDYDHMPAAAATEQSAPVGMLPARAGTPPPGVHIPPPSFRPILLSLSMTMLVAGLIIGGWALAFGVIALALTLVGWLRDSRAEYRAVAAADTTGHLDLGGAPAWPKATFAALAVLVAIGLLFTSGLLPNSRSGGAAAGATTAPGAGGGTTGGVTPASTGPSLPAADAVVTAEGTAFTTPVVTVPAGKAFTIAFDNRDQAPHNVSISDAAGKQVFKGEIVTGPKVTVYDVPAIQAGTYPFVCSVHPNMTGSITAQ